MTLSIKPLTSDTWSDLADLFGEKGACGGCWCMWWRLTSAEFEKGKGEGNRQALRRLVDAGTVPGLLAFEGKRPIGWCALAPRTELRRLERSRILAPVDDQPVWSIVCFFVAKEYRQTRVSGRRRALSCAVQSEAAATIDSGLGVVPGLSDIEVDR